MSWSWIVMVVADDSGYKIFFGTTNRLPCLGIRLLFDFELLDSFCDLRSNSFTRWKFMILNEFDQRAQFWVWKLSICQFLMTRELEASVMFLSRMILIIRREREWSEWDRQWWLENEDAWASFMERLTHFKWYHFGQSSHWTHSIYAESSWSPVQFSAWHWLRS